MSYELPLPQQKRFCLTVFVIFSNTSARSQQLFVYFSKEQSVGYLKSVVAGVLKQQLKGGAGGKPAHERLVLMLAGVRTVDRVFADSELLLQVRSDIGQRQLLCMEITEGDRSICQTKQALNLVLRVSRASATKEGRKQLVTFARPFFVNRAQKLEQIHLKVFHHF